jgi:hypothetical protein
VVRLLAAIACCVALSSAALVSNIDRATALQSPKSNPAKPTQKQPVGKPVVKPVIPQKLDRSIVPGTRVGQIVSTTTKQDLVKLFGAKNLKDTTTADPGALESFPATLVREGKKYTLIVQWQNRSRRRVARVRVLDPRWQTAEGLRLGMTFPQLRRTLGNFNLYGLDWDYSGTIVWANTKLSKYDRKLWVQVAPDTELARRQKKVRQSVLGDRLYSADRPAWSKLDTRVGAILVSLD